MYENFKVVNFGSLNQDLMYKYLIVTAVQHQQNPFIVENKCAIRIKSFYLLLVSFILSNNFIACVYNIFKCWCIIHWPKWFIQIAYSWLFSVSFFLSNKTHMMISIIYGWWCLNLIKYTTHFIIVRFCTQPNIFFVASVNELTFW